MDTVIAAAGAGIGGGRRGQRHGEEVIDVDIQAYEPPELTDLGRVAGFTLGNAAKDTADMNTARYY